MNNRDAHLQSSKVCICHMLPADNIFIVKWMLCILLSVFGLCSAHVFPISTEIYKGLNHDLFMKTKCFC